MDRARICGTRWPGRGGDGCIKPSPKRVITGEELMWLFVSNCSSGWFFDKECGSWRSVTFDADSHRQVLEVAKAIDASLDDFDFVVQAFHHPIAPAAVEVVEDVLP